MTGVDVAAAAGAAMVAASGVVVVAWLHFLFFFPWKMVEPASITLPETNIAPENRASQKEIHLPTIHLQGPC